MTDKPHIAIVGGGYSGAIVALHLLRNCQDQTFALDVIEPRPLIGGGLAYSTAEPEHRINVAAARMTPLPDDPEHFDRWFRQSAGAAADPKAIIADGRAYPRRAVFGRYVGDLVRDAAIQAKYATFQHIRSSVRQIELIRDGYHLTLDNGETIRADLVVLATGHSEPATPELFRAVAWHPRFVANPWASDALAAIRAEDWVLIIGTGLTMADTVAALRARGHVGQITAVSRRGQLSQPRTSLPVEAYGDFQRDPAKTVSGLLHRVRVVTRELACLGRPWEDVVDAIRQQAVTIWGSLPLVERQRFQRHLRPYWDAHRYQVAPQIDAVVQHDLRRSTLQVLAASFQQVSADADTFRVKLRRRGASSLVERHFHAVVNCTGPNHRVIVSGNPALASLQSASLLSADPLCLGIHVDPNNRVIGANGVGRESLLVAGPPARFTFGELMGLPQVTLQAKSVADQIATWIAAGHAATPATHALSA